MRSLKSRLKRLEEFFAATGCPGCAPRMCPTQMEYELPNGETITLPPLPPSVPCTCGRKARKSPHVEIVAVVIKDPNVVESREEAERRYAEHAAFHRPWQPGVDNARGAPE
jgi:hypothetical protein